VNIDATIVAEEPKLNPFIQQMRQNIAEILNCTVENISIKATTTEGLGFVGSGEGFSAYAVCLIDEI
jgi:2-C-methyl-D-erythritol 2,4-cyclodiphosphate synthase